MTDRSPRRVGPKLHRKDLEAFLNTAASKSPVDKKSTNASTYGSSLVPVAEERMEMAKNLKHEVQDDLTKPLGGTAEGLPLELFDDVGTYETHTPEEWIQICKEWQIARIRQNGGTLLDGDEAPPPYDGHVLHYVNKEYTMVPCYVRGYDPVQRRYMVQLVEFNGVEKAVRRLALRFISEDRTQFRERVNACKARRAHVELQQQFIDYIESADDALVAPMLKETRERFSRAAMFASGIENPVEYMASIRQLMVDIEQNHLVSMKFSRAKQQLIARNGTLDAHIASETMEATPFAKLLVPFLPESPPQYALVCRRFEGFDAATGEEVVDRHTKKRVVELPVSIKAAEFAKKDIVAKPAETKICEQVIERFQDIQFLRFLVTREDHPEYIRLARHNLAPTGSSTVTNGLKHRYESKLKTDGFDTIVQLISEGRTPVNAPVPSPEQVEGAPKISIPKDQREFVLNNVKMVSTLSTKSQHEEEYLHAAEEIKYIAHANAWTINSFCELQKAHAEDVMAALNRLWREEAIARCTGDPDVAKSGPGAAVAPNISVAKHLESAPHRAIRRVDLMMSEQLREIVAGCLRDWVHFFESFIPLPGYNPAGEIASAAAPSVPGIADFEMDPAAAEQPQITQHFQVLNSVNQDVLFAIDNSQDAVVAGCPSRFPPMPLLVLRIVAKDGGLIGFDPSVELLVKKVSELTDLIVTQAARIKTIEPDVVPYISIPEMPLLDLGLDWAPLVNARERVAKALHTCLEGPKALLAAYQKYEFILQPAFESDFSFTAATEAEVRERLQQFVNLEHEIQFVSSQLVEFPMFEVVATEVKRALLSRIAAVRETAGKTLNDRLTQETEQMINGWSEVFKNVIKPPVTEEDLASWKVYLEKMPDHRKPLLAKMAEIHSMIRMLQGFSIKVDDITHHDAYDAYALPNAVKAAYDDVRHNLTAISENLLNQLNQEKTEYAEEIRVCQTEFEAVLRFDKLECLHMESPGGLKASTLVSRLNDHIQQALEAMARFRKRDGLFENTEEPAWYTELETLRNQFEPYRDMWTTAEELMNAIESWSLANLWTLNAMNAENDMTKWKSKIAPMARSASAFGGHVLPTNICQQILAKIQEFWPNLAVMHALCTRALTLDHWQELFRDILQRPFVREAFDFTNQSDNPDTNINLRSMLEAGILEHMDDVEQLNNKAVKEFDLKKQLVEMRHQWKTANLQAVPHRGLAIIKGGDLIQEMLDDSIVRTLTIRSSPFVVRIDTQARDWQHKLEAMQRLLNSMMGVQRDWMYLDPIFSNADDKIKRELPESVRLFDTVSNNWRVFTNAVKESPAMVDIVEMESIQASFDKSMEHLAKIHKEIKLYLETKRSAFPRLYFLSDEQLLTILSQTKDPVQVQPHMNKCFDGVEAVVFNDSNTIITGMRSATDEIVDLKQVVDVTAGDNNGNVEKWLRVFEKSMRDTLRQITYDSKQDYAVMPRPKWSLKYPQQVVLATDCLYWTHEVTEAFSVKDGLKNYHHKLHQQLLDIVELIRGELLENQRQTLVAMITIDVHARDVVKQLVDVGVKDAEDFEWMSQLRYYWQDTGSFYPKGQAPPAKLNSNHEIVVKIVNSELLYGFEYLGNTERLVITPLTDRCYRTLMGAFDSYYGGAPEGPAGTGKTETTKDLSKALAVKCVVFNCSDSLDHLMMAKFFKGLASSGCWCCFDEFNRIDVEVLSVIAEQINTIQNAIRSQKGTFFFEDAQIDLISTCAINITMNPGYAGRAELPDNLKALFRPCAMMVPDYSLIAEISLYSYGFTDAKLLAGKCVASLRLSSEQLSSQAHYDFGMRALKAILRAAGLHKRRYGSSEEESVLALRALNDVNIPKFTRNDIELFQGITSDLFPGSSVPPADYTTLYAAIKEACAKRNLQATPLFLKKCIQLWETILVRHGLMLVGQTISGKSMVSECLQEALTTVYRAQAAQGLKSDYLPVQQHRINPKSVGPGMLYGIRDPNTNDFTEGVLANTVRETAATYKAGTIDRQWVVLDGPVDAVWIEDMNTVLDDNKKLCLASSEVILISPVTTMMFEVEDLKEASPATVSRCGMVFFEPAQLGWQPLLDSWAASHALRFTDGRLADKVIRMIKALATPMLELVSKSKTPVDVSPNWLIMSALRLYSALLNQYVPEFAEAHYAAYDEIPDPDETHKQKEKRKWRTEKLQGKEKETRLEFLAVFAMLWSVGACVDESGRATMDRFLKAYLMVDDATQLAAIQKDFRLIDELESFPAACAGPNNPPKVQAQIPLEKPDWTFYDVFLDERRTKWDSWVSLIEQKDPAPGSQVTSMIVQTADTVRANYFLKNLVKGGFNIILSGMTGTGKTISVSSCLESLSANKFQPIRFSFSAQTTADQTQDLIKAKLQSRGKGSLAPAVGKKALVFIDDVNMPQKEKYGAQPPIELLRQAFEDKGWFNNESITEWTNLIDMQFLGAMAPPGGSKTVLTMRFMRRSNLIYLTSFGDDTLTRIFSKILGTFLQPFSAPVVAQTANIVKGTIEIFKSVIGNLRPTPTKSHYSFNLRDMARVIQGITLCEPASLPDQDSLVKCWVHESFRVFSDRLADHQDIQWFKQTVDKTLQDVFRRRIESVLPVDGSPLMFGDFMDLNNQTYQQLPDMKAIKAVLEASLAEHNEQNPKSRLNLIFFAAAVEHVTRVIRVLRSPLGNAMLIGVGGSGRKSLSKLAAHMCQFETTSIEVTKHFSMSDWREELAKVTITAGGGSRSCMFVLSDTQFKHDAMVEDVSSFLNTGEVANLYTQDDKINILEVCQKPAARDGCQGSQAVMEWFVRNVRKTVHIVLCFSPIGDQFRNLLRMFPSLVNCCTLDWFLPWSFEALNSVAVSTLSNEPDFDESIVPAVAKICVEMQTTAEELTVKLRENNRRHNYITPSSYLELLQSLKSLLGKRRSYVDTQITRYENGILTLDSTEKTIQELNAVITRVTPEVEATSARVQKDVAFITQKEKEVSIQAQEIQEKEVLANIEKQDAEKIERNCNKMLADAEPKKREAMQALEALTSQNVTEMKSFKVPGDVTKKLCRYLVLLKDVPHKIKAGDDDEPYWQLARKELFDKPKSFVEGLQKMGAASQRIPERVRAAVYKCEEDVPGSFTLDIAYGKSQAVGCLLTFLRAYCMYDKLLEDIEPLERNLAEAKAKVAMANANLAEAQAQLDAVTQELQRLRDELQASKNNLADLQAKLTDYTQQSIRAGKLVAGLGGEKISWAKEKILFQERRTTVVGDSLISAGFVAFLGVFPADLRVEATRRWRHLIDLSGLNGDIRKHAAASLRSGQHSDEVDFSLESLIGVPIEIQGWQLNGLPADRMSTENAIVMKNSRKWPLMIDPQMQANLWLKQQYKGKDVVEDVPAASKAGGKPGKRVELTKEERMIRSGAIRVLRLTNKHLQKELEVCVKNGIPVLLENCDEKLDPSLSPLLQKQVFLSSNQWVIKLGENTIEYDQNFKLFMTTHLPNPHYAPEICTQVVLLNFVVTPEGLQEQLLTQLVMIENTQVEQQCAQAIGEMAEFEHTVQETADRILELISDTSTNILQNETLVETLELSKKLAGRFKEKKDDFERTSRASKDIRAVYEPVSIKAAHLFFVLYDMGSVDHMYQFSLTWYRNVYDRAIRTAGAEGSSTNAEAAPVSNAPRGHVKRDPRSLVKRVGELISHFQRLLFNNVSLALFERDKLLFAFMLAAKVQMVDQTLNLDQYRLLLLCGGTTVFPDPVPEASKSWLDKQSWDRFKELEKLGGVFEGIEEQLSVPETANKWKALFDLDDPLGPVEVCNLVRMPTHGAPPAGSPPNTVPPKMTPEHKDYQATVEGMAIENEKNGLPVWPNQLREICTDLEKCLLLNALRPDKVVGTIQCLVAATLGMDFLKPPSLNLAECLEASAPSTDPSQASASSGGFVAKPLLFVLSSGADPMTDLQNLATEKDRVLVPVSLGKGQDEKALRAIDVALTEGQWVVLQNCHLARSFLPKLEARMDEMANLPKDKVSPDFRMWLTAMPTHEFPMAVIQNAVKMTNEPPRGLQANLLRSYKQMRPDYVDEHVQMGSWRKLLFGLCFFHALILERRRFGALGWNISYEFSEPDRMICASQLRMFLEDASVRNSPDLPWAALNYMAAEANYGGRVTDMWDRRLISELLKTFYCPSMLKEGYHLSPLGGPYLAPTSTESTREDTLGFIKNTLPINVPPEVFGLHGNANLTAAINDALLILRTAQAVQPKTTPAAAAPGGNKEEGASKPPVKSEDVYREVAASVLASLPSEFDIEVASRKYPTDYSESMNTVLVQELMRFNRVISVIRSTLVSLDRAAQGLELLTPQLEAVGRSLVDNLVPAAWSAVSYPSLKPLSAWLLDFLKRLQFLNTWIANGPPSVFWLSGFYFTQSFLSGVLQNFARRQRIAIDELEFAFQLLPRAQAWQELVTDPKSKPEVGCLVYGLYMEGARWQCAQEVRGTPSELTSAVGGWLEEALPKKLFDEMPVLWLRPVETAKVRKVTAARQIAGVDNSDAAFEAACGKVLATAGEDSSDAAVAELKALREWAPSHYYECPVYKTSARKGTLSTTGHSTNYVLPVKLPLDPRKALPAASAGGLNDVLKNASYWTKRSVALLTQLDS